MTATPERNKKWWSEGVRFTCLGCGRCCRGEPGAIFFTPQEGEAIAENLKIDMQQFVRIYVTGRWGRPSFIERRNGDCVFYDSERSRCSVYALRPKQCSLFPFWHSVMVSRKEWNVQARHCPGMNQGQMHTAEEIETLLSATPFDDL